MKKILFVVLLLALFLTGCTKNQMARNFGGTENVELKAGRKLVNVTWKESSLWVLTRPMLPQDSVQTYTFEEQSSFGIAEGTVVIKESRP
jgi:hypothetical protein